MKITISVLICMAIFLNGCSTYLGYVKVGKNKYIGGIEITPECKLLRIIGRPVTDEVYACPGVKGEVIVPIASNDRRNTRNTLLIVAGAIAATFLIILGIGIATGKYDGPDDIRQPIK